MKHLLSSFILLFGVAALASCNQTTESEPETAVAMTEPVAAKEQLRHVVLFKFKDSSSAEDIKTVEDAFRKLPEQIEQIKDFEWGLNNSPEGLNQEFTHCFFLTFDSEEGRNAYLPHPAHKAFGDVVGPHLDKVLVVDYWAKE